MWRTGELYCWGQCGALELIARDTGAHWEFIEQMTTLSGATSAVAAMAARATPAVTVVGSAVAFATVSRTALTATEESERQ